MKRFFMIFGLVALALAVGLSLWLKTPGLPKFDTAAALETAKNYEARIVRDSYGVPHIYGKRDRDVAFGLAYAHAEDDIENMQAARPFSRGQMGLVSGRDGAISDYLVAAVGAQKAAEAKYETDLSAEVRAVLEGYTAGINLYCAEEQGRCEPGFAPISPLDMVTSFVARTPFYYGFDQQLTKLFSGDLDLEEEVGGIRESYLQLDRRVTTGSNGLAVAPSRSSDGHTRLIVNSHQPFLGPTAWYEARIKSEEGWDMIGGLFPGTPFPTVGSNPHLGWVMTVSKPDLMDFFKLTVNDEENPTQYKMDDEWLDFEIEEITIRVKLWGPFSLPVKQTIRRSIHGPVFDTPNGFFGASFAGDRNIQAIEQWYRMNKATNNAEWLEALSIQGIPSFNIIYGDFEGNIALYYNAAIPFRSPDWDWSKVAPGDRSDLVWQGVRPFGSAAPIIANPSSGFVVNGNNNPFEATLGPDKLEAEDFPAHLGVTLEKTNRGLRAVELYGSDEEISEEEFLAYKHDTLYSENSRLMVFLRELMANKDITDAEEFAEAVALIKGWDGNTNLEARGAALSIRTAQIAKGIQMNGENPENANPVEALRQAIAEYKKGFGRIDPTWGEVNRLKRGDVDLPLRGGPDTLRAIYSIENPGDGSMAAIAGDSYILYADWDENGVREVKTIHQFGSATQDESSPHYADQTQMFADEDFKSPPMTLEAVIAEATSDKTIGGS